MFELMKITHHLYMEVKSQSAYACFILLFKVTLSIHNKCDETLE
jgi:hypothetical protein